MSATASLISECLAEIEQKYGINNPNYLPYHNVEHARDVMSAARAMGRFLQLDSRDLTLLEIAACFHDIVHGTGRGLDEKTSAVVAFSRMVDVGFSNNEATHVKQMIEATTVQLVGITIIQSATSDILTQIIADADLASLGRPFDIYWDRALKLRQEYSGNTPLEGKAKQEFISYQIAVLQNHTYYTHAANELFSHKSTNIHTIKELYTDVQEK